MRALRKPHKSFSTLAAIIFAAIASFTMTRANSAAAVPKASPATSPASSTVSAIDSKKYESLLIKEVAGVAQVETVRTKISELSKAEIAEFILVAKKWLKGSDELRRNTTLSFDALRRNKQFDASSAKAMLDALKETRVGRPINESKALDSIVEKRLYLFLAAKAGQLNSARIESELKMIADSKRSSVERYGMVGVLVDVMAQAGTKPTIAQLEKLLRNDVPEIQILSVDWFRHSPPDNASDRSRFLTTALKMSPIQIFESAQLACDADASAAVRESCAKAKNPAEAP